MSILFIHDLRSGTLVARLDRLPLHTTRLDVTLLLWGCLHGRTRRRYSFSTLARLEIGLSWGLTEHGKPSLIADLYQQKSYPVLRRWKRVRQCFHSIYISIHILHHAHNDSPISMSKQHVEATCRSNMSKQHFFINENIWEHLIKAKTLNIGPILKTLLYMYENPSIMTPKTTDSNPHCTFHDSMTK